MSYIEYFKFRERSIKIVEIQFTICSSKYFKLFKIFLVDLFYQLGLRDMWRKTILVEKELYFIYLILFISIYVKWYFCNIIISIWGVRREKNKVSIAPPNTYLYVIIVREKYYCIYMVSSFNNIVMIRIVILREWIQILLSTIGKVILILSIKSIKRKY